MSSPHERLSRGRSVGAEPASFPFPRSSDSESSTEEKPSMRAVAMMTSAPALVQTSKLGLSKAPPPLGLARPPVGLGKARTESFGVQQEWSGVASPSVWDVKTEDLEMVPLDFPLERTHREIQEASAEQVSARISQALKGLSIQADFDCKKAKAKCKTSDCVSFRIRLYAGGENGEPVVVEVQRRCGPASSFMRSCRAILNAAEGKEEAMKHHQQRGVMKVPPFVKGPIGSMKCLQAAMAKEPVVRRDSLSALESVMDMLKSDQRDTNVLGLENLICLCDPVKTQLLTAVRVSKCVSLGDEEHDVREEIRVLTERDVFGSDVVLSEEQGQLDHADHVRQLSLTVFANALDTCSNDGCLAAAVEEQAWFGESLVPLLVDELKRAPTSPCIAYQAASCLCSLCHCSEHARRLCVSNGAVEALEMAHKFGTVRHELLAEETRRCLTELESVSAST